MKRIIGQQSPRKEGPGNLNVTTCFVTLNEVMQERLREIGLAVCKFHDFWAWNLMHDANMRGHPASTSYDADFCPVYVWDSFSTCTYSYGYLYTVHGLANRRTGLAVPARTRGSVHGYSYAQSIVHSGTAPRLPRYFSRVTPRQEKQPTSHIISSYIC
eukprot:scaffold236833_cov24-Prasinocladus_malaysianus.AAC.3